jgi:hypothetical protein
MRALIVMTIVVGIGLVMAWAMIGESDTPPRRVVTTASPPLPPPRSADRAVASRVPQLAQAAAPEPRPPTAVPDAEPPSSENIRDGLEASFNAEVVDASWSGPAANKLERSLRSVLRAESRLDRVECRETLCRIETSHHDISAFRAYVRDSYFEPGTDIAGNGAFISVLREPIAGGPVVAVAYVAGKGHGLPSPELLR